MVLNKFLLMSQGGCELPIEKLLMEKKGNPGEHRWQRRL